MSYLQAIILGLVQGITEFLPVSSSGHLAILQSFFGLESTENHLLFDVLLHLGTLGAVLVTYWRDIAGLTREGLVQLHLKKPRRGQKPDPLRQRMILFILLATLPLVLVVFLRKAVTSLYENTFFIGFALLVTGGLLFAADRLGHGTKNERNATLGSVMLVGLSQALATVPGLSRSGTTISVGMFCGFERSFAVKFSFLLSVPAVLGANLLTFIDAVQAGIDFSLLPVYLVGVLAAFVSGFFAISLLRILVQKSRFGSFAYYCWGAGLVTLILSLVS